MLRRRSPLAAVVSITALAAVAALAPLGSAAAQSTEPETGPVLPNDAALIAGLGMTQFTKNGMGAVSNTGAQLELRGILGTRSYLGIEGAYLASINSVDALGLDSGARLLGNSLEVAARFNLPMNVPLQPYVIGGVGISQFNIVNSDFNTSNVADDERATYFPVGAGLMVNYRRIVFDGRVAYRGTGEQELVPATRLDRWSLTGSAGFNF